MGGKENSEGQGMGQVGGRVFRCVDSVERRAGDEGYDRKGIQIEYKKRCSRFSTLPQLIFFFTFTSKFHEKVNIRFRNHL